LLAPLARSGRAAEGHSSSGGVLFRTGPIITEPAKAAEVSRGVKGYLYAYDVAYEMKRLPVAELLGQPMAVEFNSAI
jgi:hypothetical protein